MRIDWIVAVVTFIMFTSWAFAYFSLIKSGELLTSSEFALTEGKSVIDFLSVNAESLPVNISSATDAENAVIWANINWSRTDENSTRAVVDRFSNVSLPCMIVFADPSGPDAGKVSVYWLANLSTGNNFFYLENIVLNTTMQCGDTLSNPSENQTSTWAMVKRKMFSSVKNSQLCTQINTSYDEIKARMGVSLDYNVQIETGSGDLSCGYPIPKTNNDIYMVPESNYLWEGGSVNITVRLWQ